ncbi:hypothetical protein BBO99_00005727 [Phytophthora kernoviae]|uniref:Peptidase M13 C-terminal domain-containing protein n=2 Tax=Phytophthora kernoviae TaxID=325452 RepID=A0A3R7J7W9_9STRA|nr:hypothetical protein G195_006236 [Phytophthora kernoviae 00238/432]KAG2520131.1 hypothetical protein JM16_006867 [Phytophthora kernoviae]KAG2525247.1 hypothetical protein JM18_004986 [Phytophthora kernoviae]RLN36985.1 hypothetical protein BBI17_005752 [Phytophthora kernoviae]RLN78781.1 hypothetical protein BBO99_00005727 [Phytophthora kernoviae]
MERSKPSKWKKIYDEDGSTQQEDENASIDKTKAKGDEQPLVDHEREPVELFGPSPLLMSRPRIVWALAGLAGLFLIVVVLVVRGGTLQASRGVTAMSSSDDWVDLLPSEVKSSIDRRVDPCDDFYSFSCGGWREQIEIPEDKPSVFLSFSTVQNENERVMKDLMSQDWPLITAAKTKSELFQTAGKLSQTGPDFLTSLKVSADAKDATTYALYASQAGLTLPDPQYYLDKEHFDSVSDALHAYVVELFLLAGWESGAAASRAASVIAFEQKLAPLFVPKEELQDPVASYNRVSVAQAAKKYPLLFAKFVNGTGLLLDLNTRNADVIVESSAFFEKAEKLVTGDPVTLDTLKAVLAYKYLSIWSPALSEPFVQANFAFFARTLGGQKVRAPRWKVCLHRVTNNFPDLVGKYFALLRFDQASQELADQLVKQLQSALRDNLARVDWLDGPTRQAALEKLGNMTNLIGHSTTTKHFPFEVKSDAPLAENLRVVQQHAFERVVKKIGRSVDRNEWAMTSSAVNAYYMATSNQIVFPAGILQPPFFARGRHPARNFGAIGSVIGHELTHGFDDTGRHYAGDGNLADWWSNATVKEFSERAQCLVNEYTSYPVMSSADNNKVLGHVNGNYTLGENIADNGGVKLSFAAYQAYIATHAQDLSKTSGAEAAEPLFSMSQAERDLPGSAADKLFFVSFAQAFCAKASDASMVKRLATDPHSPEQWRINGVASNSRDFARVFSCPAGAPMNPRNKCQLW